MSLPYFPMFPTDFEAKTSHLTLAEDGAYNRLLRLAWMTPSCSIPADRAWVYRRLRAHTEVDQAVVEAVIEEFFETENGRLSNARLTREWLSANEAHARRKLAGEKGGKAKALKTKEADNSNATAMLKQPEPEPEPIDTNTNVFVERTSAQPPNPEQPKHKPSSRGSARGIRIPSNWAPTPIDYAAASNEGLTSEEINREADRFRDYWISATGRTATKLDWSATWRNWIRRAADDKRKRSGARPSQQRGGAEQTLSAFDRVAESLGGNGIRPAAPAQSDAFTIDGDYIVPGPRTGTC
jgi:uncharacterized protein YdaU (DUF1376 family)